MPLEDDVRELAERVARIEEVLGIAAAKAVLQIPGEAAAAKAPVNTGRLPYLLGRALLGLAGAYLLRALTESRTLPGASGVAAGILYAVLWMVWAARTPSSERLETALHSLTAALVLSPLLWEATIRFGAVSTWSAAAVLLLFTLFGLTISWRKDILILATISTLAGLLTSAGLLIATRDVLPFTLVLLAMAAAVEISACLEHWLSERWLAATAADLAVLLATWLVTNERGLPPNYAPIPDVWLLTILVALPGIYLASTMVRTLLRGFTFTFFETAQCGFALAICLNGCLRLSEQDPRIAPAVGILALLCAAACYAVSIARLEYGRNFYTYSSFGILLMVAGSRILLPADAVSIVWLGLAVVSVWGAGACGRSSLQVHGAVYLALALIFLGALRAATLALLGPGGLAWPLFAGAAASTICYALSRGDAVRLAFAGAALFLGAAIAAAALTGGYHGVFGPEASHSYCATLRTCVLAIGSLLLAWAGAHFERVELGRLIYPTMLLAAYRIFTDDLHEERKAAAVISLLVYGAALMTLPRIQSRRSAKLSV